MLVLLLSKILTVLVLTAVSAASEISTSHTVTDRTTTTSTSVYPRDDFASILEVITQTNLQKKDICTFFRKELASKSNEEIVKYLNARGKSLETCRWIVICGLHKKQDKICGPEINEAGNCFPSTPVGHNATISCPGVVGELEFDTSIDVTRLCKEDGSWAPKVDYGPCKPLEKYRKKACINEDWPQNLTSEEKDERERQCKAHIHNLKIIRYVGNSLSLVTLVISFILFWMLKSIRCWRNIIHWNLVASFILRITLWFIYYESPLVDVDESVVPSVALCKIVMSLFLYAQATNYFWMFVEGLYLHMMVVMAYSYDRINLRVYNAIGWGLPVLLTSLWAILKLTVENNSCWVSQHEVKKVDYVFQIPIIALLLINAVILGNVVRILFTKLRSGFAFGGTGPGEAAQYTKAVKAAVFLFPLLGITFILFLISPPDPVGELVFMYFNGFMQAFQGFFVCLIYCFANNEIQRALVKKIHHWRWQMRWPFCLWPKKNNMNRSGSNASLSRTHNTIVHMKPAHNDTHQSGRHHESAGSSPLLLVEHREEEKEGATVVSVSTDGGTSKAHTSV